MNKLNLSVDEIIQEIERLKKSPFVKLAKQAENKALKQKLYQLRSMEKKGKKIAELLGIKEE